MVKAKKENERRRVLRFFFSSLSCPSFSLRCQSVCREEKDHNARATTVWRRDNQVMKKREESERTRRRAEQKKICFTYTHTHIYVYIHIQNYTRWWKLSSVFFLLSLRFLSCSSLCYYQLLFFYMRKDTEDGSKMMMRRRQLNERHTCTR